jgi:uncharacterized membrane protein
MTVVVERPIHDVFEFCRDFQNFPQIVDVLLSVEDSQDGRSHWAVRSPTGHTVEWDATVTKYVPNSVIAWESIPGSPVEATGMMRFAPLSATDTRVDISVTYRPRRTSLADAIRAVMAQSNTNRLRSDLAHASQELSAAVSANLPPRTPDLQSDGRPDDVPQSDPAPSSEPRRTEARESEMAGDLSDAP